MRRRGAPWSDHRHGLPSGLLGSPSSPRSSLQRELLRCDVTSEGEELTAGSVVRHDAALLLLRGQRHLLTLVREFVLLQMQVLDYYKMVERTTLSGLEAACRRLQDLCRAGASLQRRVRTSHLLCPLTSPLHQTLEEVRRKLQLVSVQVAALTERLVLRALVSAEGLGDLCRILTIHNKVVADVSAGAAPWMDVRPISCTRALEIIVEERAWLLTRHFLQAGPRHWLEDVQSEGAVPQEGGGAFSSLLSSLIHQDHREVAPQLQMLQSRVEGSLLYDEYLRRLWPLFWAHLCQTFYPALAASARTTALIHFLHSLLTSGDLPEQCREEGRRHCHLLLCTMACISWDRGMCQALSSALTDKCVTSVLDDGARRTHSRTSAALVTVCQELVALLKALTSAGDVSGHQGFLGRCLTSLQLCDLWLRSRSQIYTTSGSLCHLLLITHGDVPVISEEVRRVTDAVDCMEWPPECQRLYIKLHKVSESLEGLVLCLPRLLGSVCSRQAQDIFQRLMPVGRHWRGKMAAGPHLVPSEYARAAVNTVLLPLLEGVGVLSPEGQLSSVSLAVGVFMEAWMEHILQERQRFSLQGALQLRCDFESVRDVLRCPELGLPAEVLEPVLSLSVFQQADNAIVCLLQQPSHKTYLQARGCSVFCCPPLCRSAVDSLSDSLQSLDSLGRRVWSHNYPAQRPRHSHDSYLPHNQRQWLSLRLHKGWGGLG